MARSNNPEYDAAELEAVQLAIDKALNSKKKKNRQQNGRTFLPYGERSCFSPASIQPPLSCRCSGNAFLGTLLK